jgi:hypothetical protein
MNEYSVFFLSQQKRYTSFLNLPNFEACEFSLKARLAP